jgi:hypothetical protein
MCTSLFNNPVNRHVLAYICSFCQFVSLHREAYPVQLCRYECSYIGWFMSSLVDVTRNVCFLQSIGYLFSWYLQEMRKRRHNGSLSFRIALLVNGMCNFNAFLNMDCQRFFISHKLRIMVGFVSVCHCFDRLHSNRVHCK